MTYSLSTLLKKYNLRPRKGLGQNFLSDPYHLSKIIEAAELSPTDTVLEIGPGPGTLTRLLAETAGHVIAVELDPHMVNLLNNELGHLSNLTIIEADILKVEVVSLLSKVNSENPQTQNSAKGAQAKPETQNTQKASTSKLKIQNSKFKTQNSKLRQRHASETQNSKLETQNYKAVANLPYYITSAVLRHLLEAPLKPQRLVVTVQKEVAQRIVAGPGKMSLLAVSVQFYGQPVLVHRIPAGAFYPPPKVDSAVVRIDTYPQPAVDGVSVDLFFEVVKAGFGQKRKQLKNALAAGLNRPVSEMAEIMNGVGIDPTRRAETLGLREWEQLAKKFASI